MIVFMDIYDVINFARSVFNLFKYILNFFLDKIEDNTVKENNIVMIFFPNQFVNRTVKENNLLGKMLIKTGEKIVK